MSITIGSSTRVLHLKTVINNASRVRASRNGGDRKKRPIFISTHPSHINLHSLSNLYRSCNHSPHRLSATADIDSAKLAVAIAHSSVVVSVFGFTGGDGVGGERYHIDLFEKVLPAVSIVTPENGELVGYGRAVSDLGLTASIYDVMVIPPLQRMGIGRMIVQRIIRMLTNRGIYDISALCYEKERLFFKACGFGDDILGSTTMMYTRITSSNLDDHGIIGQGCS